jgi:hypothetical protein
MMVPDFVLSEEPSRSSEADRQRMAIDAVGAARARIRALARGEAPTGSSPGTAALGEAVLRRRAADEAASIAGLRFTAAGMTRELYDAERRRLQSTAAFRSGFQAAGTTFFDQLRAFRSQYRARVFAYNQARVNPGERRGEYESAERVQSTRMTAARALELGYYDLAQRMSILRNSNFSQTRQIPVTDVRIEGRLQPTIATVHNLAVTIGRLTAAYAMPGDTISQDLVSVTIQQLPLLNPAGTTYMAAVFTGAVQVGAEGAGGGAGAPLQASPALVQALEAQINDAFQSGTGVDWEHLYNNNLVITVQVMRAPRVHGWSPRVEVEQYFIKSTLRYVPPQVFIGDTICLPVAILLSALREVDEHGNMTTPEYVEVDLGDDDETFQVWDTREQANPHYYEDKVEYVRDMALCLMEEAFVDKDEMDLDSCQAFADALGIRIHVLYKEAMCRRLFTFGAPERKRSVTILVIDEHAFPVLKPWRLTGNGMPSLWCDECHSCVTRSWSADKVAHHRKTCDGRNGLLEDSVRGHGKEFVHKRFTTLWHKKENRALTGPYCLTCGEFCISAKSAQETEGMDGPETGQLEECAAAGHNILDDVEMGTCTTCDKVLPVNWPEVADAPKDRFGVFMEHRCELPKPELQVGDESKYYVWDIETLSVDGVHVPIYIYARALYDASKHYEFDGMDAFCKFVISKEFKETTWVAHNSGGFDSNFVHAWLEDRGIMHTRIPSPTSMHRSLETMVDDLKIRFIDSFCFIPMGLAKIGPAFNLPVHKGDFPHKFSTVEHMTYRGPMPPCDTEEDWYSLSTVRASSAEKAEVATTKFKAWHAEEALKYMPHTEVPWDYQEQLRAYCKKDCDVLAGALCCMRDSFMQVDQTVTGQGRASFCLCPVDPLQYLTMAQVCQQLYIAGMYAAGQGFRIAHIPMPDRPQHPAKVKWLLEEERKLGRTIWKGFTHLREWLADDGQPVDGHVKIGEERHIFEYYDCVERGCVECLIPDHHNARYGCSNREVYNRTLTRLKGMRKKGYKTHVRWTHDEAREAVVSTSMPIYDCMTAQRQRNDGGFYGGRVEVFKPMWRTREGEKINYIDVVSLYPWVCATQRMCTGVPQIYIGAQVRPERLQRDHPQAYFGYAHVKVKGCKDDYFGGVPRKDRESGRLVFDNSEYRVTCFIDELRERIDNGATVLEVYEVWHWDEVESLEGPMSGYVAYFLRDKMECSGWKALCGRVPETEDDKAAVCDHLEAENLGLCRPRPDKVADNPGGRQLAKLRLNMLWGKFVQTPKSTTLRFIAGYEDYVKLWFDNQVDKSTLMFRRIRDGLDFMEVRYGYNTSLRAPVNTHYYLGGSCTAAARLKLTSMLRRVGPERALYCDTDSVVYVQRPGDDVIETGEALGQWSSEMDEGVWGEEFLALAPKCYMLRYNEAGAAQEKESGILKAKGVTLTAENLKEIHADSMRRIILTEVFGDLTGDEHPYMVQAKTFNIRMNHAGDRSVVNMYGEKVVRCVYSKRHIVVPEGEDPYNVHYIDTVPFE